MTREDKLQSECVKWFRLQYPQHTLFAIPNGGNRSIITGSLLKKTGTLAGVADLFLMHSEHGYNGLFVEMKVGKNKLTDTQQQFCFKATNAGYSYKVCKSFDEFMTVINEYIDKLKTKQ